MFPQIAKSRLVTTLPRALTPWRQHLLAGLQLARSDPSTWTAFDRYADDVANTTLRLTQEEWDAVGHASQLFGTTVKTLLLDLGSVEARRLLARYPSLTHSPGTGSRAHRRYQIELTALPSAADALNILRDHGLPQMKKAIAHPLPEMRKHCLVIPLPYNRVIAAGLQSASNAGLQPLARDQVEQPAAE